MSSCAYGTRKVWLRPFVTPCAKRVLLWPHLLVAGWDEDRKPKFQPRITLDLGFLGCLRLVDLAFKRSWVCCRNKDVHQPGNIFFRVLRPHGDSRGVSTGFFTSTPDHSTIGQHCMPEALHKSKWIGQVVHDRPDFEMWWRKLYAMGVLGQYGRGAKMRVRHIEEEWLEFGQDVSKRKRERREGNGEDDRAQVKESVSERQQRQEANIGESRCVVP